MLRCTTVTRVKRAEEVDYAATKSDQAIISQPRVPQLSDATFNLKQMKTRLRNRHTEGLYCPKRIVHQKIQFFHHLFTLMMILVDFSSSVKHKRRCLWCFVYIQCKSMLFQASCMDSHCMGKNSYTKYLLLYSAEEIA